MGRNVDVHIRLGDKWVPIGELYVSTAIWDTLLRIGGDTQEPLLSAGYIPKKEAVEDNEDN